MISKIISILIICTLFISSKQNPDDRFVTYIVDPQKQNLQMFLKDDADKNFGSIQNLKTWIEKNNGSLVFAMNAGMYKEDNSPLGLYIENKKTITLLNTSKGNGNFYMQPNGVFYLTVKNVATICSTQNFKNSNEIKYATQSGPMLVIDGNINSLFKEGSTNLNIRNGVGILPGNKIVFAMSKKEINFYDFADYFKSIGCKNALYLDGFVSRTYLPEKDWNQTDGNFGVIIAVTKTK